jgi:hypothetical protein
MDTRIDCRMALFNVVWSTVITPEASVMRLFARFCLVVALLLAVQPQAWTAGTTPGLRAKVEINPGAGALAIGRHSLVWLQPWTGPESLQVHEYPQHIAEHDPDSGLGTRVIELTGSATAVHARLRTLGFDSGALARKRQDLRQGNMARSRQGAQDEVRVLVESGPSSNRIDLVFMGDGYTEAERENFFADAARLTNDLFTGQTFAAYLPLFNVHAVFRPSLTSGIGKGSPTTTAYKLYREGNTLRAILPGDPQALRQSCGAAPDCDYPVVVANDDYYGGLGGEFAITTRSPTSGTVVLRHELGHNFGRVGEEYDGGGYFGANTAKSLRSIGWRKWLDAPESPVKPADLKALALGWPWQDITSAPYLLRFKSDGTRPFAAIRLSMSGLAGPGAYDVLLNNEPLESPVLPTSDRTFVDLPLAEPLPAGEHTLEIKANRSSATPYVSSITVHEYGFDPDANPDFIGAFPVFDPQLKIAGYRPTNEGCLMRNMMHPWFCSVCQENNWRQLLGPLKLIDGFQITEQTNGDALVTLKPMGLGQFRKLGSPRSPGETMRIRWRLASQRLSTFDDQTQVTVPSQQRNSRLRVEVQFVTPEVRNDDKKFTEQNLILDVSQPALAAARR